MPRKAKVSDTEFSTYTVRLPEDLKAEFLAAAKKKDLEPSQIFRHLLRVWLKGDTQLQIELGR